MRWPLLPQDLRLRLVAAFVIVAALSQLHDLATAAIALAGVGLIAFATGVERSLWRRLLHVESFVLLLFLTLPFTVPAALSTPGCLKPGLAPRSGNTPCWWPISSASMPGTFDRCRPGFSMVGV